MKLEFLNQELQYLFETALITEIHSAAILKKYSSNETLIEIGAVITHMPFLLEGTLKVMTEDNEGDELLLYYLEKGETCAVSLNCCSKNAKSVVKAIVEDSCTLLFIPIQFIDEWMAKYPSWRAYILESYNNRMHELFKAIDMLVFHSLEDRLKQYLEDKFYFTKFEPLSISHQEIANDLHSSRVVVSRIMKKLEKQGWLIQSRNKVSLLK